MASRVWTYILAGMAGGIVTLAAMNVRLQPPADSVLQVDLGSEGAGCGTTPWQRLPEGIAGVRMEGRIVTVTYDSTRTSGEKVAAALAEAGYPGKVSRVMGREEYRKESGVDPCRGQCSGGCGGRTH